MIAVCGAADVERFRGLLARELGWSLPDSGLGGVADVLARRAEASGLSIQAYLAELTGQLTRRERRELARELTVGETYFFRNIEQFRAFSAVALPQRSAARAAERRLRILSAGCASGEEAYSIAIAVREQGIDSRFDVTILAVDVSQASLERAAHASYSGWSLRETAPEMRKRWFVPDGRELTVDREIREMVRFEERNLASEDPELWAERAYDIVFCRNVMMYFTLENAQRLVARLERSIAPGGFLFLGHAETLRGLSQTFHLHHTHGTFYYTRHDDAASESAPVSTSLSTAPVLAPPVPDPAWAATWIETVRRASARIQSLSEASVEARPADPRPDVDGALQLLKGERFGEALDRLGGTSPATSDDPSVLLLRAVLLTHRGSVDAAERTCASLLEIDELNAGARYVLALCRESAGDRAGAIEQDQIAAYLDPGFAMARLHLGLLARREGDRALASRELALAAALLQREDPSRLLLFGGGFSREGLVALCRSELAKLGQGT